MTTPAKERKINHSLINSSAVRKYTLAIMKSKGRFQFERVGNEFLERADAHLQGWIRSQCHSLPAIGKTIK